MISMLLPGLRDLRVPLAAGALWLFAAWIGSSWALPANEDLVPIAQQLAAMSNWAGVTAVLAALAFLAYLVGILLAPLSLAFLHRQEDEVSSTSRANLRERVGIELRSARRRGVTFESLMFQFPELQREEDTRMDSDERWELASIAHAEAGGSGMISDFAKEDQWRWLDDQTDRIVNKIVSELSLSEVTLQALNRDLYDKYDRTSAEAEFRHAISIPLLAVIIALTIRTGVEFLGWYASLLLVALPASWVLERSARAYDLRSNDLIVQAVLAGKADSPTIKLISDLDRVQ